jgi:hypothetical protein
MRVAGMAASSRESIGASSQAARRGGSGPQAGSHNPDDSPKTRAESPFGALIERRMPRPRTNCRTTASSSPGHRRRCKWTDVGGSCSTRRHGFRRGLPGGGGADAAGERVGRCRAGGPSRGRRRSRHSGPARRPRHARLPALLRGARHRAAPRPRHRRESRRVGPPRPRARRRLAARRAHPRRLAGRARDLRGERPRPRPPRARTPTHSATRTRRRRLPSSTSRKSSGSGSKTTCSSTPACTSSA